MTTETQVNQQSLPIDYHIEDYRIVSVLGQGGFGITYKAEDETLRRFVAVKEYLPQQFAYRDGAGRVRPRSDQDDELFQWGLGRFVDEGRALAMFRHPNIASVIRFIQQNGTAYLVMEFEEGMDLSHWLAGRERPDEQRLVRGILVPVLEGLARVHDKGLLHRDIKPDNIFIRRDGSPVLIDFGASRPHGPEAASRLTSIISAGYSPFEQYGSGERQGPWSDLYALAGTMYRVISGNPPVDAIARQQGTALVPATEVGAGKYSKRLLQAIDKAMSLEIGKRPQDAREFLEDLGIEPPPRPVDPEATVVRFDQPPPGGGRRPRSRGPVAGVVVVALLAIAGAVYYTYDPTPPRGDAADEPAQREVEPEPPGTATTESPGEESPDESVGEESELAGIPAGEAEPPAEEPSAAGEETPGDVAADEGAAPGEGTGPTGGDVADRSGDDVPAPAPGPDRLDEERILLGLEVPSGVRSARAGHLTGVLGDYTRIKARFDDCQASGCSAFPSLFAELQAAMDPQSWDHKDGAEGYIDIENPRRLENEDCPYMLDVEESFSLGDTTRKQVRTYCTSNGLDREVQDAKDVT